MREYDAWWVDDRVTDAQETLALAAARLHRAQVRAVLGIRYDDVEYDRAVEEYRRAARELTKATEVGRRWQWWPHQPPPGPVQAVA